MNEKCRRIQDLFSDYIDQRLSHQDLEDVRAHLKGCKRCSKEYESFRSMIRMLHTSEKESPPQDFIKKVNQRIDDEKSVKNFLKNLFEQQNLKVPLTICVVGLLVFIGVKPFYKQYINKPYMVKQQSQDISDKIRESSSEVANFTGKLETGAIANKEQLHEPYYQRGLGLEKEDAAVSKKAEELTRDLDELKEESFLSAPRASSSEAKRKVFKDELAGGFVSSQREKKEKPRSYQMDNSLQPAVSETIRKQSIYIGPYILTVQSESIKQAKEKIEKILKSKNIDKLVLADNEDSFSEVTVDITVVEFNSLISSMIERGIVILDIPAVVDRGKSFPLRISIKTQ